MQKLLLNLKKKKPESCGFRVAGFGFRVAGFEFRVSGYGLRVAGCSDELKIEKIWNLGFGIWVLEFGI
jgi:hypothetical protein